MTLARRLILAAAVVVVIAGAGLAATRLDLFTGAVAIETRPASGEARFLARAIVAVSDADMAGTAYADGRLRRIAGASDALTVVVPPFGPGSAGAPVQVSNSVMGWPGAIDASPDGRFVYVVETRGPAPDAVEGYAEGVVAGMPGGRLLTTIDVSDVAAPRVVARTEIGGSPSSVHVAPDGRWLALSVRDDAAPLVLVTLADGRPDRIVRVRLGLPDLGRRDADRGLLFVRVAPGGEALAFNVGNTHVGFARVAFDAAGRPSGAAMIGELLRPSARWLTMLRWANDGRHLLVSDVGWGPRPTDAVFNGPGRILSLAFDPAGRHRQVAGATVSLSPEAFELSPRGDLVLSVDMERTYLPEGLPYALFGRRERWSLSLLGFDQDSGGLALLDGPVGFEGVLPEDVVFGADGAAAAVVVYHERAELPRAGWLEYVRIDRSGPRPRIVPTGQRTPLPRGAHDLVVLR